MINTIEKTLSPVFLITFFFGFGILRYPLDQSRYRLSFFYILTVWSVYAYVLCYTTYPSFKKSVFKSLIIIFQMTVNLFVTMISIIINICKHEKYRQCIRKLGQVDDTLEELGTSKEYRRMQNFMKYIFIVWFLITYISWIFDCSLVITLHNDIKAIVIPFVANYCVYTNTITDITFFLLLRHIGNRLDKINDHIEQLSKIEDYGLRCKWKKCLILRNHNVQSAEHRKRVLWILIHLHSELCRIARDINSFFGIQMALQMMSYFIILIGMFYFQFHAILYSKQLYEDDTVLKLVLSSEVWFIVFLIKLISLNHICESVSTKAQKTKGVLHKLTNIICFTEVRKEIHQFVLQMSQRPLKFSGVGLFYFGYDFIRKFFTWMITAIIFLVQINYSPIWFESHDRDNVTYNNKYKKT